MKVQVLHEDQPIDKKIFAVFAELDFARSTNMSCLLEGTEERVGSIKVSINANDHNPPHLHTMINGQKLARLNLTTGEYMDPIPKEFSRKDQRTVRQWAMDQNQNDALIQKFRNLNESVEIFYYFHKEKLCIFNNQPKLILG